MSELIRRIGPAANPTDTPPDTPEFVKAIREQTDRMTAIAVYEQSMATARAEQEGRSSLARMVFTGSVPLMAVTAAAIYSKTDVGLAIAKVTCFVGSLLAFQSMMSSNDRWKHEKIALSKAIRFEKLGVGDGIATGLRDLYESPGLLPGRVESAGTAASAFWLAIYMVLVWMY